MAQIWKPLDIDTYLTWIRTIQDEASDELSNWESSFIDSIYGHLMNGRNLSERQAVKLESIYAEKTK